MAPEDRELPISLRGIEDILRVLHKTLKEPSSIRQISIEADLSIRVTKNILLQLEALKQVQQHVEEGQVTSKWTLTALGRQIAQAIEPKSENSENFSPDSLLANIRIPKKIEEINNQIIVTHKSNQKMLSQIHLELSKTMGVCYSMDFQTIAEKLGFSIQKIKNILTTYSSFRSNPLVYLNLKKKGKHSTLGNKEKRALFAEILLINQLLSNLITEIQNSAAKINKLIDQYRSGYLQSFTSFHAIHHALLDNLHNLHYMIQKRELNEHNAHNFDSTTLNKIQKNQISFQMIQSLLPEAIPLDIKDEMVVEELLKYISTHLHDEMDNRNFVPLIDFSAQFLENNKYSGISLEDIEKGLNILADRQFIVGIRSIQNGNSESYKVIQLTTHDLMEDELRVLRYAIEMKSFSLTEIINELHWEEGCIQKILEILTGNGILRHTESFLHGEKWYIIM